MAYYRHEMKQEQFYKNNPWLYDFDSPGLHQFKEKDITLQLSLSENVEGRMVYIRDQFYKTDFAITKLQ